MKGIIANQRGVTLIETVVATAIIAILLTTVIGALLYGQKMIVFTDEKNNAAAIAQEQIDAAMAMATSGTAPPTDPPEGTPTPNGYRRVQVASQVDRNGDGTNDGYAINVKIYYNNDQSYVELEAYAKKGGL